MEEEAGEIAGIGIGVGGRGREGGKVEVDGVVEEILAEEEIGRVEAEGRVYVEGRTAESHHAKRQGMRSSCSLLTTTHTCCLLD